MSAEFVWRMEDVIDLYSQVPDPHCPLVCVDERPCQLLSHKYPPEPPQPGKPQREDYQYERNGYCNVFMCFAPFLGWRTVIVSERRTKVDFAACLKTLIEEHFPQAQRLRLVLDNLNTHSPASLYEAFDPSTAHALSQKLEIHYTPKHGSWLNLAESERSVLVQQGLNQRIGTQQQLAQLVSTWQEQRNQQQVNANCRFTLPQARDVKKLDFHFNASLTALNLAKLQAVKQHQDNHPFVFSMASVKRRALTEHLLDTSIAELDLEPTLIKSHPNYQKLRDDETIAA